MLVWGTLAAAQPAGDANCDGAVDATDRAPMETALFSGATPDCPRSDANGDGVTSAADLVTLVRTLLTPGSAATGPIITFFGLASADGGPVGPLGSINGTAVYFRTSGSGFRVVVEGQTGSSNIRPGTSTFSPASSDPLGRPDLQLESSNALGDGNPALCAGGVPAVNPPDFADGEAVTDALNDLACTVGVATSPSFACTQDAFGVPTFLTATAQLQFCLQVSGTLALPQGETTLTARLRDIVGNLGPPRQLLVRVGSGPFPPTFTPAPTFTAVIVRPTATPSATRTLPPPTSSPTRRPVTATEAPATPPAATATPARSPTVTFTHTRTPTRPPSSPSATVTPSGPTGPVITFLGITRADDTLAEASGTPELPVYTRPTGEGFSIVVEGKPGPSGAAVGCSSYRNGSPLVCSYQGDSPLPDLQIETSQSLGNGSLAVCDTSGSNAGGVPGIDPPSFVATGGNIAALNDFGCRFVDGQGVPKSRMVSDSCVLFPTGEDFANPDSTAQFCGFISSVLEFPPGDTTLTVRLRDVAGNTGAPAQLVVRVGP